MRVLTAIALVAIALGAIMHFWPSGDRQQIASPAPEVAPRNDSAVAPSGSPAPVDAPATSAPPPEPAVRAPTLQRPPVLGARIDLRAPHAVRTGGNFSVTIDVQALRGLRHLEFSVTYKKSILRLTGTAPGTFAEQAVSSVQFEESSDGYLIVRIDLESGGLVAGAGSIAVLEFQALTRGTSPLSVQDVTYVEDAGQERAAAPDVYEGSITVE